MPFKDPIKKKEYMKEYREKNKEKLKQQRKEYHEKNKEKQKEYLEKNKDKRKEYEQSPQGKKSLTISDWKRNGLIGDYDNIYKRYLDTTNCELCNVELCDGNKSSNRKVMDHCHITGEFRNVVCRKCNVNKSDKKIRCNNKSGYKNIHYRESQNRWVYSKKFKGKTIYISSKNKIDILSYKFAGIILYRY